METDKFKVFFKYYKSRNPPPKLDGLLQVQENSESVTLLPSPSTFPPDVGETMGLSPPQQWGVYSVNEHPGLLVVRGALTPSGEIYWASRCLTLYPNPPNINNIVNVEGRRVGGDWWNRVVDSGSVTSPVCRQMRWATLGYHHDWDTKLYSADRHTPMPDCLAVMTSYVAKTTAMFVRGKDCDDKVEGEETPLSDKLDSFTAEAAIVNYYHPSCTLSPHTDHSEPNRTAPLLSISLGLPCVFLIGGTTKSVPPTPIPLLSGDILVMGGNARQCYHAVPLVADYTHWQNGGGDSRSSHNWQQVKETSLHESFLSYRNYSKLDKEDKNSFSFLVDYLANNRLNINVRQVNFNNKSLGEK